jgi:hypothetical protein
LALPERTVPILKPSPFTFHRYNFTRQGCIGGSAFIERRLGVRKFSPQGLDQRFGLVQLLRNSDIGILETFLCTFESGTDFISRPVKRTELHDNSKRAF